MRGLSGLTRAVEASGDGVEKCILRCEESSSRRHDDDSGSDSSFRVILVYPTQCLLLVVVPITDSIPCRSNFSSFLDARREIDPESEQDNGLVVRSRYSI